VALAYVIGFFVLLAILGWHPTEKRMRGVPAGMGATPAVIAA
jgi:hypothetical protein